MRGAALLVVVTLAACTSGRGEEPAAAPEPPTTVALEQPVTPSIPGHRISAGGPLVVDCEDGSGVLPPARPGQALVPSPLPPTVPERTGTGVELLPLARCGNGPGEPAGP